ncbi:MAG: 5-formyltetrahydrofolate cyclo-ligase [Rhodospirillaceae bacterium]|nr:5-formyltetrahydrofolate cyclo-ligase [Rhodospirillaceae bacterium]MBT3930130.1 5-formyltetrahydrofolate cyclo-ligase [Rhodospirillaceae bacterium]MBT4772121.1 5-formyltetrahydrofolate cyclo-ligase [Rhodospirillaceae bacterium]MBT5359408.1 5-formyltetrahydrofolate cyclo-ligase [Rhodospirillaceae bacterium]MBT5768399.1 5-formyltetrahydrofolate cyclo-ligase [Rhodospirillaceae bacterium]
MDARKADVRASARDARDALASGLGAAAATGIAARFMSSPLSALAAGTIVAGYMPMRSEIDPRLLMDRLAAAGSVLCLPDVVAEGTPLAFRRWVPDDPLDTGRYGISVPSPDADEMVPDLVLVPMLAFDRQGHRLGYGGGYYDRTIARLREVGDVLAVGLAFSGQVRDELPVEPHDMHLDWIITESAALPVSGL